MNPKITVSYCDGCHIQIICPNYRTYNIVITDGQNEILNVSTNESLTSYDPHSINFKFIGYNVKVYFENELIFSDEMNLDGKKVKINFDSHALGDCIAWMAQVDRFQKLHNCELYVSCAFKDLFENVYPNMTFSDVTPNPDRGADTIIPGLKNTSCKNFFCFYSPCKCYYASFDLGFYSRMPSLRGVTLSKVASDMLGMDYQEESPKIWVKDSKRVHQRPYVCIGVQSTAQYKYWNNKIGWQEVADYLNSIGYDVLCIDKNDHFGKDGYINSAPIRVINKTGDFPLQERITDLLHCDFFIGLGSGLSWLAWALEKPVVMISGFSNPDSEFSNPYRVFNSNVCNSCWNDISVPNHSQNGWSYCPRNKNWECSTEITSDMVIEKINLCIENNSFLK
jgi:autotransporter strand-loop-strand O-heptosyltransferase